jgi:DNA mismatch endonuclease, patch repair protein
MSRQATRDTEPELALRRRLHAAGYRFRVDLAPLPGLRRRADVVFTRRKVAVFVDGCFWHSCPEHGTMPTANREWWQQKLVRTVERDAETNRLFASAGWTVVRVWEHEDPRTATERVLEALGD